MKAKHLLYIQIISVIIMIIFLSFGSPVMAQDLWVPLPPYNILWPLWSPVLSPPDALGVPTPLLTTLNANTILPIEPVVVWDPSLPYFYLLYSQPWDPGIFYYNYYAEDFYSWPPDYLTATNPVTGALSPVPLSLPAGYETLMSLDPALWLHYWVPLINTRIQDWWYGGINPYLLTPVDLLPASYTFNAFYIDLLTL